MIKLENKPNTWLIWLEFKSKKLKWASSVTKYVLQVQKDHDEYTENLLLPYL